MHLTCIDEIEINAGMRPFQAVNDGAPGLPCLMEHEVHFVQSATSVATDTNVHRRLSSTRKRARSNVQLTQPDIYLVDATQIKMGPLNFLLTLHHALLLYSLKHAHDKSVRAQVILRLRQQVSPFLLHVARKLN